MSTKTIVPTDMNGILSKAKNAQIGFDLYSNVQRVTGSPNEIIIDFYAIMPDLSKHDKPQATHLQRIVLPLATAAELSKIIASTLANVALIQETPDIEENAENHSED